MTTTPTTKKNGTEERQNAPPAQGAPRPPAGAPEAGRTLAMAVYALYLLAPLLFLTTAPVGVVLAYVFQDQGAAWVRAHFRYQISLFWRAFWYAAALALAGLIGTVVSLGLLYPVFVLLSLAWAIWLIVRAAQGLRAWNLRQPIAFGGTEKAEGAA